MRVKVCRQDDPTSCPIPGLDCTNYFSAWDCPACSYCPLGGLLPAKQYIVEVRAALDGDGIWGQAAHNDAPRAGTCS